MLATALNMPQQNVHCVYVEGSGCYGQNKADDVSLDAAVISQAVGKPVRVAYMRSDEHDWENYGQAYTVKITAAFDNSSGKAKLSAWKRDAWTSTRGGRPGPPASLASGILMGFPETPQTQSTTLTPSQPLNSVDGSNSAPPLHRARGTPHQPHRASHLHGRTAPLAVADPEHVRERDAHGRARALPQASIRSTSESTTCRSRA